MSLVPVLVGGEAVVPVVGVVPVLVGGEAVVPVVGVVSVLVGGEAVVPVVGVVSKHSNNHPHSSYPPTNPTTLSGDPNTKLYGDQPNLASLKQLLLAHHPSIFTPCPLQHAHSLQPPT